MLRCAYAGSHERRRPERAERTQPLLVVHEREHALTTCCCALAASLLAGGVHYGRIKLNGLPVPEKDLIDDGMLSCMAPDQWRLMEQPIEGSEQASWWPEDSGQKMEMGKRVKEKRNRGGFLQKTNIMKRYGFQVNHLKNKKGIPSAVGFPHCAGSSGEGYL
jgi:hypothetical protein